MCTENDTVQEERDTTGASKKPLSVVTLKYMDGIRARYVMNSLKNTINGQNFVVGI
jgi:hypothetical protein